jgi:hypothetical protein
MPPTATTPRTLADTRAAFLDAVRRDTPGTDLPRYVQVVDALLEWSAAREGRVVFRSEETPSDAIAFGRPGARGTLWKVRTASRAAPMLEIAPPGGLTLSAEQRAHVMETLNAHSRTPLVEGERLRIGFGALKNVAARTAVLALLDELLEAATRTAESGATR